MYLVYILYITISELYFTYIIYVWKFPLNFDVKSYRNILITIQRHMYFLIMILFISFTIK